VQARQAVEDRALARVRISDDRDRARDAAVHRDRLDPD